MEDEDNILIRRAKKGELLILQEVYQSAYQKLEKYAYTTPGKIKNYLKWLYSKEPEGFFVAEKEGKTVGFISIHTNWQNWKLGRTGEIHELAVRREFQGKGIGKKLFLKACQYAKKKGCRTLSLWVGEENWYARSWYEKLGFKKKGGWGEWIRMVLEVKPVEETGK